MKKKATKQPSVKQLQQRIKYLEEQLQERQRTIWSRDGQIKSLNETVVSLSKGTSEEVQWLRALVETQFSKPIQVRHPDGSDESRWQPPAETGYRYPLR